MPQSLLNNNTKSYMGIPTVLFDLTFIDLENAVKVIQVLQACIS